MELERNNARAAASNMCVLIRQFLGCTEKFTLTGEWSMLSDISPANAIQFLTALVGIFLLLKKIAEMEKFHTVRVVVLTLILSWLTVMFFLGFSLEYSFGPPEYGVEPGQYFYF
ncbi:MAG TPA: hypothetical protein VFI24_23210 [Pyrinomonadaceae bacterium]|nr:hypothetical protein [Pyrinomonadaceae bacterium]